MLDPDRLWETVDVRDMNSNRRVDHAEAITAVSGVAAMVPSRRQPAGEAGNQGVAQRRAAALSAAAAASLVPVVRMAICADKRRGNLAKRLRRAHSFRSVLSLDVEYGGYMPNLKISRRNTIQATGCQSLEARLSSSGQSQSRANVKFRF